MADKSKIEWTDATWNPVTGCTPISEGCANCYAKGLARRFPQIHGPAHIEFEEVRCHNNRLQQPYKWNNPRRVFVCSMGDLFHDDVPFGFLDKIWKTMFDCQQHTFIILTKRPQRLKDFAFAWHKNTISPHLWIGVTAENQEQADARIPILLQIPAAVRWVSVEPLLSEVDIRSYLYSDYDKAAHDSQLIEPLGGFNHAKLNWVVCGAETGSKARLMELEWARDLRDQCEDAGVPFFFKKSGQRIETPDDLKIHEYPENRRKAGGK